MGVALALKWKPMENFFFMVSWEHFLRKHSEIDIESYLGIWESLSEETEKAHCYF